MGTKGSNPVTVKNEWRQNLSPISQTLMASASHVSFRVQLDNFENARVGCFGLNEFGASALEMSELV